VEVFAMRRSLLLLCLAAVLSGCGFFGDKLDPQKNWTVEQFYQKAREEMDAGNYASAVKLYEALEAKFPFGRFAQQAQIEIAYAHYKEADYAQATSAVERFVKLHPNHPNLDYALYLRGLINFRVDLGPFAFLADQDLAERDQKAARESFEAFKELVQRFPESRYAEDATLRMRYLVDALARNETKIADYYLRRGAFLAAANRAQNVITRYPNATTRQQALEIMQQAYARMGIKDLAEDTGKVLQRNYASVAPVKKSWWRLW
jgi:outer membrane protein assembly factor BamD